jgi:hypothetical protein
MGGAAAGAPRAPAFEFAVKASRPRDALTRVRWMEES